MFARIELISKFSQCPKGAESRSKYLPCECLQLRIILESVRFRNLLEDSSHSDCIDQSRLRARSGLPRKKGRGQSSARAVARVDRVGYLELSGFFTVTRLSCKGDLQY